MMKDGGYKKVCTSWPFQCGGWLFIQPCSESISVPNSETSCRQVKSISWWHKEYQRRHVAIYTLPRPIKGLAREFTMSNLGEKNHLLFVSKYRWNNKQLVKVNCLNHIFSNLATHNYLRNETIVFPQVEKHVVLYRKKNSERCKMITGM